MDRRYIDRIYLNQPVPADSYLAALPAVRALGGLSLIHISEPTRP